VSEIPKCPADDQARENGEGVKDELVLTGTTFDHSHDGSAEIEHTGDVEDAALRFLQNVLLRAHTAQRGRPRVKDVVQATMDSVQRRVMFQLPL